MITFLFFFSLFFFFCVFQKITVAECIETQSKAMTMLTIDQLSFLLKFALQKMKQPGVSTLLSSPGETDSHTHGWSHS